MKFWKNLRRGEDRDQKQNKNGQSSQRRIRRMLFWKPKKSRVLRRARDNIQYKMQQRELVS